MRRALPTIRAVVRPIVRLGPLKAAPILRPFSIMAAPAPAAAPGAGAGVASAAASSAAAPAAGLTPLRREERWMQSSTPGVRVNTVRWPTSNKAPKGAVCFVHGYSHYTAVLYDWMATVLAGHGIACFGIEHQGHGKSEGLKGYVPSFSGLVDDCLHWAAVIRERELPAGTPLFLYGESLGGGIALHAALKEPHALSGLVLFAPMTGLAEGLAPPWIVEQIGKLAAFCMPTAPLAPVKDLVDLCFKNEAMRPLARADPHRYSGGMRLGTAFQLKGAMEHLSAHAHELSTPFLLLHGTADRITSHHASERVFEACAAADKTLLLYEDAWHVLWCEATDTRRRMLADLTGWLAERCDPARRAAAALPIKVKATRPAGVEAFEGAPGEATTVFTLASHPHLYEGSSPQGVVERLDAAAAQAALRRPAPRMGAPAVAEAIERAAEAATAGAAPLPPVESAAGDVSPAESIVDAAVKRVESMPAVATAAEAAAPS